MWKGKKKVLVKKKETQLIQPSWCSNTPSNIVSTVVCCLLFSLVRPFRGAAIGEKCQAGRHNLHDRDSSFDKLSDLCTGWFSRLVASFDGAVLEGLLLPLLCCIFHQPIDRAIHASAASESPLSLVPLGRDPTSQGGFPSEINRCLWSLRSPSKRIASMIAALWCHCISSHFHNGRCRCPGIRPAL